MLTVRRAIESDVEPVRGIFEATYGSDYTYPGYYSDNFLKKLIYGDGVLMFVAEDSVDGVVGTAAVVLDMGAYADLIGEFGRLAVHPDHRGRGIGHELMEARLTLARERLHVAFMEARVVHPFSVRIAVKHGFVPVGFLPVLLPFGTQRESAGVLVQYFGQALELRRNHPRVVPELRALAAAAMSNVGLSPDAVVDDAAPAYPPGGSFAIESLTTEGYSELLRIERGRLRKREVFGRFRLHYGFFRLAASHSNYLIARDGDLIAGGMGFTYDEDEHIIRVFEVICADDRAIRQLMHALIQRCEEEWEVSSIEIDVSADAARMQRTLIELAFVPAVYVPAMAFHNVERIDVVRMIRLLTPLDLEDLDLEPATRKVASIVLRGFLRQDVMPKLREFVERIDLFQDLTEEQARSLVRVFKRHVFTAGHHIFEQGQECEAIQVVLEGQVDIVRDGVREPLATVGPSECFGEIALLARAPHSGSAVARTEVRLGVLERGDLRELVRQRPDIGVVLYRNLACGLGDKLRAANLIVETSLRADSLNADSA